MKAADDAEVAIVGGGVAGSALAIALARAGHAVTILEKSAEHVDRVRGEWLAPWGVAETERLGLYDLLIEAGGHHLEWHIPYSEELAPETAVSEAIDLRAFAPSLKSPLCMRHPVMCDLLNAEARRSGATLLRGVHEVTLYPGVKPELTYRYRGTANSIRPRIVVGADGRNSIVRNQAGIKMHRDTNHHLMTGMLVDQVDGWPAGLETMGTEEDINFLVFPQSATRARLYICYRSDQKSRFVGEGAQQRFLDAFRLNSVPGSEYLAKGIPAGPCYSYGNEDTWTDSPVAPGVILIGDCAGHNDPIIGQGLSIAYRDVRIVRDLMLDNRQWSPVIFQPYVEERSERMRRLRLAAGLLSVMFAEFGLEARARRLRIREKSRKDPMAAGAQAIAFVGPEVMPREVFTEEYRQSLLYT
jgi:2-polyprenyl-6-methoxyphenol hydroxylase-like FAD-dependent oxidoreductase